ncbi:hypothetical protein E2C01_041182 [Portunus trituberculatus]|uniref:Uncharacterized protein n=1 Tax=Portunus trituberculatus TaxID=210409 RepID=A0A5B7FPQ4_PORTR|nr:hypothetical protein [Portunus trituberculatus]
MAPSLSHCKVKTFLNIFKGEWDKISTLLTGETLLKNQLIISVALETNRGEREQSVSEYRTRVSHCVVFACPWTVELLGQPGSDGVGGPCVHGGAATDPVPMHREKFCKLMRFLPLCRVSSLNL